MSKQPTVSRDKPAKSPPASQAGPGSEKTSSAEQAAQHAEAYQGRIAQRAYELYEQRGRHDGGDLEDWLNAERALVSAPAESR